MRDARRFSMRMVRTVLVAVAIAFGAGEAQALPKLDSPRPAMRLLDGWDREIDTAKIARPLLVVYEDEGSSKQNLRVKRRLMELRGKKAYRNAIANLLIADVSAYDHWPAKDVAKGELRKLSTDLGMVVYADFSGEARKALGADKGSSNILLYSAGGRVLFARSGELDDKAAVELFGLLAIEAGDQ
jgi:hypothetical protein